jgi:hypothetical protein
MQTRTIESSGYLDFLLLPAFRKAIATACFCGLPAFFSVLMLELIVLREDPFLSGMADSPKGFGLQA